MIFLRQSYNTKPLRWGSPADIEYAIKVNAERVYNVDPDSIVLAIPLFWGLPPLDYSGNRNDGTNYGPYYKDGELSFDGNNDYIDCGNNNSLNLSEGSYLTIGAWIKIGDLNNYHRIFQKEETTSIFNYFFDIEITTGKARCGFYNGTSNEASTNNQVVTPNLWYYVVVSHNTSANTINFYVNGMLVPSGTSVGDTTKDVITNTSSALIGKSVWDVWMDGFIGEVHAFNIILTADQTALLHALPYGLYQPVARVIYSIPASPSEFIPQIIMF